MTFGSEVTKLENTFTKDLLISEFKVTDSYNKLTKPARFEATREPGVENSVIFRNLGIWELIGEQQVWKLSKRPFLIMV